MKRLVKWSLDKSVLKLSKSLEDPKAIAVIEAEFDLILIYPDFLSFTEVQQQLIVYGTKQKLMDVGAGDIGDGQSKIGSAKTKWNELLEGKWAGERVNSTGAAENKRVLAETKEASKAVTLEGLIIKRTLYASTFTVEDAAKLEEFLSIAVEVNKSRKAKNA
jgi:hypothetical protein